MTEDKLIALALAIRVRRMSALLIPHFNVAHD